MAPAHKSENGSYFRNVFLPNYTSSFGVQIINYLVPLILIPYIVRVVGPERYGTLALATAICSLFFLITDYGYQFTAPRKIALLRDTPVELNRYFSILLSVKALLYLACFVFAVGITLISTYVQQYFLVYFFSFIAVAGDAFSPTYLFQGIEKIKYSLYFSALSKIFSAPAIFLLVKTQSDFYLIPALTGGFQILAAMGALIFARRRLGFFLSYHIFGK
jgi:PST family polysaccharide transporter